MRLWTFFYFPTEVQKESSEESSQVCRILSDGGASHFEADLTLLFSHHGREDAAKWSKYAPLIRLRLLYHH